MAKLTVVDNALLRNAQCDIGRIEDALLADVCLGVAGNEG